MCSTSAWTRGGINYDLEVERNSYSASFALFRVLLPTHCTALQNGIDKSAYEEDLSTLVVLPEDVILIVE